MSEAAEGGPDNAGPLRLFSRSAAVLWGLHYSLLYPSLAVVLVVQGPVMLVVLQVLGGRVTPGSAPRPSGPGSRSS